MLHGQNKKTEEPPLALFCLCTPFGPPSLLEIPHKEVMFKSKHKLDFGFVSMDQRGKEMLQYEDEEMSDIGGYDLVHYDDLSYVASAHQECKYIHSYYIIVIPESAFTDNSIAVYDCILLYILMPFLKKKIETFGNCFCWC